MNQTVHTAPATGKGEITFESLVEEWKDMVYNTALSILQNSEDAEDVTQDVFLKVFQSLEKFRGEAKISTWIYRITINQALDAEKKKKRGRNGWSFFGSRGVEQNQVDFEHPGVLAERKENAALLFKVLNVLPDSQKAIFVLNKIEGLGYQDIAEIMGTTRMAVESKMKRAKETLSKKLKQYERQFK